MTKQSVLLLMSGGVDSSTAGAMLLEQGFRVVGATMKQLDVEPTREMSGGCCSFGDVRDAKRVAAALGIDHYTVNTAPEFNQKVIVPFINSYEAGFTPNPCVRCNSFVRFEEAFDLAKQWDCDYVATGHYARLEVGADGKPHMYRAAYREKDQSYYLYGVRKELLKMIRFPLGELTKAQVRDHAKQLGLVTAEKEESQEICFTLGRSYNEFLAEHIESKEGPILNQEGAELGKHKGVASYTVGQRKGLGLSGGPFYVTAVDPKRNAVIVGSMDDLGETSVTATSTRWIHKPQVGEKLQAKIRSRHEPAHAAVNECGSGKVAIKFEQPQYGVAPGQALVLFRDDEILGGGMIVKK